MDHAVFIHDENGTFGNNVAFEPSEIRVFNAISLYGLAVVIVQYWKY